ncbi:MAG: zinc ABC transporter substrate-binding protein [Gammaproteobacteria bacterium]|nr:zinc ABC transporter substrate-binding protein [Gammaproteobacteria bacterium]
MKKFMATSLVAVLFTMTIPAMAELNVFACEPEWASLASEIGGERIRTYSATTAFQDPHHIEARPSLIARVRRADLVICSGAELEVGWLPLLQRQAGNPSVLPGKPGYFEAAAMVERLDIPVVLDRSVGDVHAQGNPHVHLDPRRIQGIARALQTRLIEIDPDGKAYYQSRLIDFNQRWQQATEQWQYQAKKLKGTRIVVHHRDWVYLFDWLGIQIAGALEPKPGLPTSVGHLLSLKQALASNPAAMIVHTTYQNPRAAKRLAQMTNIPVVELPYTVGGDERVTDLFSLFDVTIQRLMDGLQ